MPKRILWDQKKNIRARIVDKYFTIIEEFFQQIEKYCCLDVILI